MPSESACCRFASSSQPIAFTKSSAQVITVELVCLINGRLGNSSEYDEAFKDFI